MFVGIIYAAIAACLWGLTYLVPLTSDPYSPEEIIVGRFLSFGFIALIVFIKKYHFRWGVYSLEVWKWAILLSFTSKIIFTFFIVKSLLLLGIAIPAIMVSLSPIFISIYGNWICREFSFSFIVFPMIIIIIGLCGIYYSDAFLAEKISPYNYFLGIMYAFIALCSWSWFIVQNARMIKTHQIGFVDWICLLGITLFFSIIFLSVMVYFFSSNPLILPYNLHFMTTSVLHAIILGILPQALCNKASILLPITLLGQLFVLETLAALIYHYCYLKVWPDTGELIGSFIILAGVSLTIKKIYTYKKALSTS